MWFTLTLMLTLAFPYLTNAEYTESVYESHTLPVDFRFQRLYTPVGDFSYIDYSVVLRIGGTAKSVCGEMNKPTGTAGWYAWTGTCYSLEPTLVQAGRTYYLYRNDVLVPNRIRFGHAVHYTESNGEGEALMIIMENSTSWEGTRAWEGVTTKINLPYSVDYQNNLITYEYRYTMPGGVRTYYSPYINDEIPVPANKTGENNTGYIENTNFESLTIGDNINEWLEAQTITGAVTKKTLTRNESSTLIAHQYKATCDTSGASGIVDAQGDVIGYGTGTLKWTITDYQGDITIFTQPITVVNNNYNYKVTADVGGTATPTAEGTGTSGAEILITATPATGYEFDKWVVVDGKAPASYGSAVTVANNKFTMPSSDVHIKATFKKINYTVNAYGELGKGSGTADKTTANMGDVVTLTATPEPGFMFVGWVDKNGNITDIDFDPTDPNASFKMPADNVEVQATFVPIPPKQASIAIRKTVVGNRGNANDVFLISMKEGSTLVSSLALKRGETSGALALDMGSATSKVITISEIIPMDYATGFTVSITNQGGSKATLSGKTVTIHPGDDVTITVENTFAPTEYFKGKDFVKNIFK